jgi:hypothetical protein
VSCLEKHDECCDSGNEREENEEICDVEGETDCPFTIRGNVFVILVICGTIPRSRGVACMDIAVDVQFVETIV